jgi:uncharacterized protein with PQ loop repeat
MVSTEFRDFLGIFGGVVLSICTIPQLWLMWKKRSAKDLSYLWMWMYLVGLSSTLAYLIVQNAYAAYIPASFEVFITIVMLISKFILDRENARVEFEQHVVEVVP